METAIKTIEYRGFNINIYPDEMCENPRDWNNIGIMACTHPNYLLGDKDYSNTIRGGGEHVLRDILAEVIGRDNTADQIVDVWGRRAVDKTVEIVEKMGGIIMPLFLLDHSGLWMSTGRYACDPGGWDTSHVGFIFCTKEKIEKEYGNNPEAKERAYKYLVSEVDTYSNYLSGSVYGYVIEPQDTNKTIECNNSCWGFYGYEWDKNGLLDDAKGSINYAIKEYKQHVIKEKARKKDMERFMKCCWAY